MATTEKIPIKNKVNSKFDAEEVGNEFMETTNKKTESNTAVNKAMVC
jgi:hypothetical protein